VRAVLNKRRLERFFWKKYRSLTLPSSCFWFFGRDSHCCL